MSEIPSTEGAGVPAAESRIDALKYVEAANWFREHYQWDKRAYVRKSDNQVMTIPMILLGYSAAHSQEIAELKAANAEYKRSEEMAAALLFDPTFTCGDGVVHTSDNYKNQCLYCRLETAEQQLTAERERSAKLREALKLAVETAEECGETFGDPCKEDCEHIDCATVRLARRQIDPLLASSPAKGSDYCNNDETAELLNREDKAQEPESGDGK